MIGRKPIIAIDGPSGSGKSTVAKALAAKLGLTYIDTGAMYRCAALAAIRKGINDNDGPALTVLCESMDIKFVDSLETRRVMLNEEDVTESIRSPEITMRASSISARPEVRKSMVSLQRRMGVLGGVVMEGRDIGTNVFPNADVKIFLTADDDTRAKRRFLELTEKNIGQIFKDTLEQMKKRDAQDSSRALNPLMPAPDAIQIDTSSLSLQAVIDQCLQIITEKTGFAT